MPDRFENDAVLGPAGKTAQHLRLAILVLSAVCPFSAYFCRHYSPLFAGLLALYLLQQRAWFAGDESGCLVVVNFIYCSFLMFLLLLALLADFVLPEAALALFVLGQIGLCVAVLTWLLWPG